MKDRDKEAILKKAKEILQKQLRFKIDYCLQNGGDMSVQSALKAVQEALTEKEKEIKLTYKKVNHWRQTFAILQTDYGRSELCRDIIQHLSWEILQDPKEWEKAKDKLN